MTLRSLIRRPLLAALLLLALGPAAMAQIPLPEPGPDEAVALITGKGEAETLRGQGVALQRFVVRLTLDPALAEDPRLQPLWDRAPALGTPVAWKDMKEGIPIHDEQGSRDRQHALIVRFDRAAVVQALADLGIPVWERSRPEALPLRIRVDAGAGAFLVGPNPPDPGIAQRAAAEDAARLLGLPLPILTDAADPVPRLEGTAVLRPGGQGWDLTWSLHPAAGEAPLTWQDQARSFDTGLETALSQALQRLRPGG